MTQNDQAAMNEQLTQLRLQGLSIDGDNRYKQDLINAVIGAMMFGAQGANPPPAGHWLEQFYVIAREEREALARVEAELREYTIALKVANQHTKSLISERDTAQAQLAEAVGLLRFAYDHAEQHRPGSLPNEQRIRAFLAQAEQQEAKPVLVEAQGAQAGDEHENFEAWHRSVVAGDPPHEKYHDGSYVNQHVNRYWTGWLARAALATQPAAREPIGKVELFGINMTYVEWRERKMPPLGTELYTAPPAAAHGDDTRRIDWLACTWRLGGKLPDVDHGSFREVIDAAMRAQGDGGRGDA